MHAQACKTSQHQNTLSLEQSLTSVQTLLRAGLGCITYLRNLLPEENFCEAYLTSLNTGTPSSSQNSDTSRSLSMDSAHKRDVSGFKIMTIARGFTDEADALLNYLENGIFDAVEKQYLKSFTFAVCLDGQDPNNIVEAYTFNFKYYTVPGTDMKLPVMSLDERLTKMSLNGSAASGPICEGKIPTLGDVKRSLRTLARNLIQATTPMDDLPKRRFATFKLFYYDHTPEDYNPPHFRQGDVEKDRWYFTTHNVSEVPERCSVGTLETGWHGVNVHIASIASLLPSPEDNNAIFTGTTGGPGRGPVLTSAEEARVRAKQIEVQKQDANDRKIVYAADGVADEDAEEIDGLNYVGVGATADVPIGMRSDENTIVPLSAELLAMSFRNRARSDQMNEDSTNVGISKMGLAMFPDTSVKIANHVRQLREKDLEQPTEHVDQTQQLTATQDIRSPTPRPCGLARLKSLSLPPSEFEENTLQSINTSSINTQLLKNKLVVTAERIEHCEMLDMETQMPVYPNDDPIESFGTEGGTNQVEAQEEIAEVDDKGLDCACGICLEDCDLCWCDACGRWYHSWCMGYHSAKDKRLPDKFICFDCHIRADRNWEFIALHDLYYGIREKFKDLALFRRAIKLSEVTSLDGASNFEKKIGCALQESGRLFQRLEKEGFIAQEKKEYDDLGLMEVRKHSARTKGKTVQTRQRKNGKRMKYIFVQSSKKTTEYKSYFNPELDVVKRLAGLKELNPPLDSNANMCTDPDSQTTQDDTQHRVFPFVQSVTQVSGLKRKATGKEQGQAKKVKVSLASIVDLGN